MGLLSDLFESRSSVVGTGNLTDDNDFWYSIAPGRSSSGKAIGKDTAMRLWVVYACITLISETVANLPLKLKRPKAGGGTEDATDHPLFDLLKYEPNPEMNSFTWRETTQGHILSDGNKFNWIERNRQGIKGIWPIEPRFVTVKRADNSDIRSLGLERRNSIVYKVRLPGDTRTIPSRDMLHVPGFGFNGLVGESPITNFARETIGNGLSLSEFQGKFFKNGVFTSGVLEHPMTLGKNADAFKEALRARYQGGENAGVPMVLENGMKWVGNKISLVDQQYLELMNSNALEVCGMFKVPPSKVGIYGKGTSYNNTETQNSSFWSTTIAPWVGRDEQALMVKLLTPEERKAGYFIKYNFDSLLRPNAKDRAAIDQIHWQMGVPLNEMRYRDDLNPVAGGELSYIPANCVPAGPRPEPQGEANP